LCRPKIRSPYHKPKGEGKNENNERRGVGARGGRNNVVRTGLWIKNIIKTRDQRPRIKLLSCLTVMIREGMVPIMLSIGTQTWKSSKLASVGHFSFFCTVLRAISVSECIFGKTPAKEFIVLYLCCWNKVQNDVEWLFSPLNAHKSSREVYY